jgi:uncharacterized membrane protein
MLDTLTTLTQPWADYYAESAWLPTALIALHVLALFVGGGIALGADRRLLQATAGHRDAYLATAADLKATHGIVIGALVLTNLSGLALFTSDVGTFWGSRVFWAKMATLVVLILNGVRMRSTEAQLLANAGSAGAELAGPYATLRTHAWVSVSAWCLIVVLGVVVANI